MATPSAPIDLLKDKEIKLELALEEKPPSESPRISDVSQADVEKDIETQAVDVSDQLDENVVWWDEPVDQDPENPMNWGAVRKWGTIAILGFITFITPLASSFFAP